MDDVHSINGEHPVGLALDIVPNKAAGGSWNDIDRLAGVGGAEAEPASRPVPLGRLRRRLPTTGAATTCTSPGATPRRGPGGPRG